MKFNQNMAFLVHDDALPGFTPERPKKFQGH